MGTGFAKKIMLEQKDRAPSQLKKQQKGRNVNDGGDTHMIFRIARRALPGIAAAAGAFIALAAAPPPATADEQYLAIPSIRVGPYNAMAPAISGASSTT